VDRGAETYKKPSPDEILARLARLRRGRLKIYLGAAPGVGKTYTMLADAHEQKARGVDVVVGMVDCHDRPGTEAQIGDLEVIPPRLVEHKGIVIQELDVEGVLARNSDLVLIDELDVHLHPRWQRRVAADLKATFPAIQFVCTSHSPQIIGELPPNEIRLLKGSEIITPNHSYGVDSSRVLEELMDAKSRNNVVGRRLGDLANLIDQEKFEDARKLYGDLALMVGEDDPEMTRAKTLMAFLESKP
jgi:hypothetical protein